MRRPRHGTVVAYVALVVALGGTASAATGGTFLLGKSNSATHLTTLTDKKGTALSLKSKKGAPPLKVNRSARVRNLNADLLDGQHAKEFVGQCGGGSIAAAATWYATQLDSDPTYDKPDRYGGENGWSCNGATLEMTKEGTGYYRMKLDPPGLPSTHDYVAFVNPDARGGEPLYADANSKFAGPIWDIHVFNKDGTPTDPYYVEVLIVADS
jgi:hypothetical protein